MSRRNSLAEKAQRRLERQVPRKPGSLKPFRRVKALMEELTKANEHFDALLAVRPGWLAKIGGRPECTPEQAVAIGDAQEAVVRAREALVAYKSRGHSKPQRRFG